MTMMKFLYNNKHSFLVTPQGFSPEAKNPRRQPRSPYIRRTNKKAGGF